MLFSFDRMVFGIDPKRGRPVWEADKRSDAGPVWWPVVVELIFSGDSDWRVMVTSTSSVSEVEDSTKAPLSLGFWPVLDLDFEGGEKIEGEIHGVRGARRGQEVRGEGLTEEEAHQRRTAEGSGRRQSQAASRDSALGTES